MGSLHLYEQHFDAASNNLKYLSDDDKNSVIGSIPSITGDSWNTVRKKAVTAILNAEAYDLDYEPMHSEARWYAEVMVDAIKKNKEKNEGK